MNLYFCSFVKNNKVNKINLFAKNKQECKKILGDQFLQANKNYFHQEKITTQDLIDFCLYIRTFYKAENSILKALKKCKQLITKPFFESVIIRIIYEINSGKKIFQAFQVTAKVFDEIFLKILSCSDKAPFLECIQKALEHLKEKQKYSEDLKQELIYPSLLFTMLFINININFFLIVPTIQLTNYHLNLFRVLYATVTIFTFSFYTILFSNLKNHLPIIKNIFLYSDISLFNYTIYAMIKSQIPLNEAVNTALKHLKTTKIKKEIQKLLENIHYKKSHNVDLPNFCTNVLVLAIQEDEGNEELFKELSEFYIKKQKRLKDRFIKFLSPVIMAFVGLNLLFVMYLVLSPFLNSHV